MASTDWEAVAGIDDEEDPFASPSQAATTKAEIKSAQTEDAPPRMGESRFDAAEIRDAALKKELESVRGINEVLEGVIASLEKAKDNMETVSTTVKSSSTLLNTWTRILSQTEHNQRLLLNPNWRGATQDVSDMENEAVMKQQAAERRAAEEERRREEARRKAEDEERQRQAGTAARGTRGARGRGLGRGAGGLGRSVSSSGYGQSGASASGIGHGASATPGRAGSGIGRGVGSVRGRARGVR